MQIREIIAFYDYTYWATDQILETAANLSEAQLNEEIPNGMGSIRTTLVHLLSGHCIWYEHWRSNKQSERLKQDDFPTLESIRVRWQEEKPKMYALFATLCDEDLERLITYSSTMLPGQVFQLPLWQLMMHLVNHGTQHRSEVAMKLTELGHSPGELSMNAFFITRP